LNEKSNDKEFTGDFMETVNAQSKFTSIALMEPCMRNLNKGDHIQIQRRGF